jgi:carnitine O-acetyltransferase
MVLKDGEAVPALFGDALVKRSSYWALSTSAVFSKHFDVYGWGEVVPDGFGVAYMTGFDGACRARIPILYAAHAPHLLAEYLQFTVTSRTEMPNAEFVAEIARSAEDLHRLFADETKARL